MTRDYWTLDQVLSYIVCFLIPFLAALIGVAYLLKWLF